MVSEGKTKGLRPWKPGQSGNPNGRPKGTLTNADLVNCVADALCLYTKAKDRKEALTQAVYAGLKAGRLTIKDLLAFLVRCAPVDKTAGASNTLADLVLKWPGAE